MEDRGMSPTDLGLRARIAGFPIEDSGTSPARSRSAAAAVPTNDFVLQTLLQLQDKLRGLESTRAHREETYYREKSRGEAFRAEQEDRFQREILEQRQLEQTTEQELIRLRQENSTLELECRELRECVNQQRVDSHLARTTAKDNILASSRDKTHTQSEVEKLSAEREEVIRQTKVEEKLRLGHEKDIQQCRIMMRDFWTMNSELFDKWDRAVVLVTQSAGQGRVRSTSRRAQVSPRQVSPSSRRRSQSVPQQRPCSTGHRRCGMDTYADPMGGSARPSLAPYAVPVLSSPRRRRQSTYRHTVSSRARERRKQDMEDIVNGQTLHDKLRRVTLGGVPFIPAGVERTHNTVARAQQGISMSQRPDVDNPNFAVVRARSVSPANSAPRLPPPPPPKVTAGVRGGAAIAGTVRQVFVVRDGSDGYSLGMELEDDDERGVVITAVVPGRAAARAGLYPGQEIVSVEGTRVRRRSAAESALANAPPSLALMVSDPGPLSSPYRGTVVQGQASRSPLVSPRAAPRAGVEALRARLHSELQFLRDRLRAESSKIKQGGDTKTVTAAIRALHAEIDRHSEELLLLDQRQEIAKAELREGWNGPPPLGMKLNQARQQRVLTLCRDLADIKRNP
eukprot:Hpha_TRINITY_DN13056_c0_g1::TRINITY_DN13056_c0_g1_i1::g.68769::m.68769